MDHWFNGASDHRHPRRRDRARTGHIALNALWHLHQRGGPGSSGTLKRVTNARLLIDTTTPRRRSRNAVQSQSGLHPTLAAHSTCSPGRDVRVRRLGCHALWNCTNARAPGGAGVVKRLQPASLRPSSGKAVQAQSALHATFAFVYTNVYHHMCECAAFWI